MRPDILDLVTGPLWRASWQGACLVIVVVVLCGVLRRVPARWRAALWFVVLVRLLLPAAPASPLSLFNLFSVASPVARTTEPASRGGENQLNTPLLPTWSIVDGPAAIDAKPASADAAASATSPAWTTRDALVAVWLIGLVVVLADRALLAVRLRRLLAASRAVDSGPALETLRACCRNLRIRRTVKLMVTDRPIAPAVAGILRPIILVPTATLARLDEAELRWLFRHELAHVRRGDVAIASLWSLVCAIHWFNPLVWWGAARSRAARELACDEAVLHTADAPGRRQYGGTLLRVAETMIDAHASRAAVSFLSRRGLLQARITAIIDDRRASWFGSAAGVGVLLALAGAGLTDALGVPVPSQTPVPANASAVVGTAAETPAADETRSARTMHVTVVGPEGEPLRGASIRAAVWTDEPFQAYRYYHTDQRGRATVALPGTIDILRMWVRYPQHVHLFAQWYPKFQTDDPTIPPSYTFKLARGTTIGGTVVNEAGQPIQGARVEVRLAPSRAAGMRRLVPTTWLAIGAGGKVTDAAGRWSVDNVPADEQEPVLLMLSHPGYASETRWGGLQRAQGVGMQQLRDGSATIAMSRGHVVSGTVRDPEGKPAANALVVWGDDPYHDRGSQELLTDRHGMFRLPPRPAGPLNITVVADGWAPLRKRITVRAQHPPLEFALEPGKTVRFEFVDQRGDPIPYVQVDIDRWRGSKSLYNRQHHRLADSRIPFRADQDGIFRWTWAPEGEVIYNFSKEGLRFRHDQKFLADNQVHVIRPE